MNAPFRPRLTWLETRDNPAGSDIVGLGGTAEGFTTALVWEAGNPNARLGTPFDWFGTETAFPARQVVGPLVSATSLDVLIVAGPGGGSRVGLVNGRGGVPLAPVFNAFEDSYNGGLNATMGDLDGVGGHEVIVAADEGGGARVAIYSATGGTVTKRADFFAFQDDLNFRGGARVAVGDVNGDGRNDLIVTAGFGGGPRVAIFDGRTLLQPSTNPPRLVNDFFAFPDDADTLRNGVFVTAGDFTNDGRAELVFGGGPGGAPRVLVLNGALVAANTPAAAQAAPVANFFVNNDVTTRGGVRMTTGDIASDGTIDLVLASGAGVAPLVRTYRGNTIAQPNGTEPPVVQSVNPFTLGTAPSAVITSTSNGSGVPFGGLTTLPDGLYVG